MTTVFMAAETCDHFDCNRQVRCHSVAPLERRMLVIDTDLSCTMRMSGGSGMTGTLLSPQVMPPVPRPMSPPPPEVRPIPVPLPVTPPAPVPVPVPELAALPA